MKKIISYTFLLLGVVTSCNLGEIQEDGYGYLSVGVAGELEGIVQMKSDDVQEKVYRLEVYDSDGIMDASIDDHRTVTAENPIRLLMDKYEVVAISGERGTAFNSPCYSGSNSVRVLAEQAASVDITARMGKVKFSVAFPEDDEFKAKFSLYELAVSNGTVLTFSSSPDPDDPTYGTFDDVAYFEVPENKTLTYTLRMTNADGAQYSATNQITQVAEAEHYHFEFKLGEREAIDGAIVLNISVDGEYDEVRTHEILLNFDKLMMPSYTTNVEFDPVPADGSTPVWPLNNDTQKKFIFEAPRGIRNLVISHLDPNLLEEGLPQLVDFVDISAEDLAVMNEIGITASTLSSDDKSVEATIDITEFVKNLRVTPDNETYMMSLTVVDEYDRYARCDFRFVIVSDIQAETGSVFRWSSFATLNGRYFSKTPPEGMTFLYRKTSDQDWIKIDPSLVSINTQTMTYSCTVKGLTPDTEYVFKSTSDKDVADNKVSAEVSFRTYKGNSSVYNLSFDEWVKDGKAWYATNDKNNNLVWDSANEGTADILGQSLVPTTPEESIVISGKAVKMKSGELMGNFAAGNIYTGDFGSATLTPMGAKLKWGIPFTSRPLALRGWYRYEPQSINRTSDAYSHLSGQTDFCQIQIFLTNWTQQFEISTGDNRFVDTSKNNKEIIAYGAIVSQDNTTDNAGNTNGYIRFTIPLEYRNLNDPTYIVISAAASRYGDYFTGALNSTLYLDELELIYDPEQLTDEEYESVMKGIR